jgi:uncharacterized cupin superfamily protein
LLSLNGGFRAENRSLIGQDTGRCDAQSGRNNADIRTGVSKGCQDEFVYILEGTPILVTSAGEMPLRPGMCAGFKAGSDDAHQLRNRSDTMAVYLEMGDRTAGDVVTYPDDDIKIDKMPDGRLQVVRKDGSPY